MIEDNEITVSLIELANILNFFVWKGYDLIAKIWLYPDGSIYYRSFVPKTTPEISLRDSQIQIEKDIKFNTPPKKIIPMRIKFELKDPDVDQDEHNEKNVNKEI